MLVRPIQHIETVNPTASSQAPTSEPAFVTFRLSTHAVVALVAGALASGLLDWSALRPFEFLALWFLSDLALGAIFAGFYQIACFRLVAHPSRRTRPRFLLPFAEPGSPGWRLGTWIDRLREQWKTRVWPQVGRIVLSVIISAGLAWAVTGLFDSVTRLVVTAAVGLGVLIALIGRRWPDAFVAPLLLGLQVVVAWTVGHLVYSDWTNPLMGLGFVAGMGTFGRQRYAVTEGRAALWLVRLSWGLYVGVLLLAQQPILAGLVAATAVADDLLRLQPRRRGHAGFWGEFSWLASWLVVAVASTYWDRLF